MGWNAVREIARDHDVWVLTSLEHRDEIEEALADESPTSAVRLPGLAEVALVHEAHPRRLRVAALLLADRGVSEGSRSAQADRIRSRASRHGVPLLDAELPSLAWHSLRLGTGRRRRVGAQGSSGPDSGFAARCSRPCARSRDSSASTIPCFGCSPGASSLGVATTP